MESATTTTIDVYPPDQQGQGSFDGGKITEIKPIGFPSEPSPVDRLSTLFYWAWASSTGPAKIGLHPHQGFEIISYVLEGQVGHYDTAENRSRVPAGGAQVMQTGSGISHEEEMLGERTQFFQIWFEPDLQQSLKKTPTYLEVQPEDFPVTESENVECRTIIGEGSPVVLDAAAKMLDVTIQKGGRFVHSPAPDFYLALVVIAGTGKVTADSESKELNYRDFAVVASSGQTRVELEARGGAMRVALVEVPREVDYPLYKGR